MKPGPKPKRPIAKTFPRIKTAELTKHKGNVFEIPWGWWQDTAAADRDELCECLFVEWDADYQWEQRGETSGAIKFQRHDGSGDTTLYALHHQSNTLL
jgi:hypothetical protein